MLGQADISVQNLIDRRDSIKLWAKRCSQDGIDDMLTLYHDENQPVGEPTECRMGDATLFNGIGCLAARLSGDTDTAQKRCRDVEIAQSEGALSQNGGRFWRGYSEIGNEVNKISFSRDMAEGVLAYFVAEGIVNTDINKKNEAKERAKRWIEWIDGPGKGALCVQPGKKIPQACKVVPSFAGLMYRVFKAIGAIDDSNKKLKFVKRMKRNNFLHSKGGTSDLFLQNIAYRVSPKDIVGDYEFHLKSVALLIERLIADKEKNHFTTMAKNLYQFDSKNPVYQLFYEGAKQHNLETMMNLYCPATKYKKTDFEPEISFYSRTSYFTQSITSSRKYYIAMGHDCIYALNLYIAHMSFNNLKISVDNKTKCGLGKKKLGIYEGTLICKKRVTSKLSQSKCSRYNGITWPHQGKNYCLIFRSGRYLAKPLKSKVCPGNSRHEGFKLGDPICRSNKLSGMALSRCHSFDEYRVDNRDNPKFCLVPTGGMWIKKPITRMCPLGHQFIELHPEWKWPLCKPIKAERLKSANDDIQIDFNLDGDIDRVAPKACGTPIWYDPDGANMGQEGQSIPYLKDNYCGVPDRGHFKAKRIDSCPIGAKWSGDYEGKSLCKKAMSLKIRTSRCQKKNGIEHNGYCLLQEKSKYFWVKSLK
jgi:hypothetical protein